MTWVSVAMAVVTFGGFAVWGLRQPTSDYSPVGPEYCTRVVNRVDDTVGVFILAPRTDSAVRPLGVLMPGDSGIAVLPYHVPPVLLVYIQARGRGGWWVTVQPDSILPCRRVGPP